MRLYQIATELEQALQIDEETGEILPGSEERMDALQIARDEKCLDIACLVVSLEAEETAIREQAKKLTERARIVAKRSEWLRLYLCQWLPEGEKLKDDRVILRIGSSESVEIREDADIPADYLVPKFSVDKKAVKVALEAGTEISGAKIVRKSFAVIK